MAQQYVKVYRADPYTATEPGIYECGGTWTCREANGTIWTLTSGMNTVDGSAGAGRIGTQMTEDTFLKALAVAQDPTLAKDLIRG